MFKYILKSLKNEKGASVILIIPIIISVFLFYFSVMIIININNISENEANNIYHNFNYVLWSDTSLSEDDYKNLCGEINGYKYLERNIINGEYEGTNVTIVGSDFKKEYDNGIIKNRYSTGIVDNEFADDKKIIIGSNIDIKTSNSDIDIYVDGISDTIKLSDKRKNIFFISNDKMKCDIYSKYFLLDIPDCDVDSFKKLIYEKYSMMNLRSKSEEYETIKSEYSDIIIGIVLLTSLSLIVSCLIVYHFFYMRILREQKKIGQIRSLGIRDKRCFHIYLYKNYVIGLIGSIIGIICAIAGLQIINKMNIYKEFRYIQYKTIDFAVITSCFLIQFILLLIIYIVVVNKLKKISIIQNLREHSNNFTVKKHHKIKIIIGMIFYVCLSLIKEDRLSFYDNMDIMVRVICASVEIAVFFLILLIVLPEIVHYVNKILEKIVIKYDIKSIIFPLKSFITNENQIMSVFSIFIVSTIVSIGIYGTFNSFSDSIISEVDNTYKFTIEADCESKINNEQYEYMKKISGISYVDEEAITNIKMNGVSVLLNNVDLQNFNKSESINISKLKNTTNKDKVVSAIVTSDLAEYMKWSLGQKYEINLGGTRYEILISDIVKSSSFLGENIYINSEKLKSDYPYWIYRYKIGTEKGYSIDKCKADIKDLLSGGAVITDIDSIKNQIIKDIIGSIGVLYFICIAIMVASFISVMSILVMYIKEQKTVFASMMALGCNRKMIIKSILFQYILVVLYGSVISLVLSPLFLKVLISCMASVTGRNISLSFDIIFSLKVYVVMSIFAVSIAIVSGLKNIRINILSTIKESTF